MSKVAQDPSPQAWIRAWDAALAFLQPSLSGITIAFVGPLAWVGLWFLNLRYWPTWPWAAVVMSLAMLGAWIWITGRPGTRIAAWVRRGLLLRAGPRPEQSGWTITAILSTAFCVLSVIFVSLRLGRFEPGVFAPSAGYRELAPSLIVSKVLMTSVVAGVFEELGFRGRMQWALAKGIGPAWAVAVSACGFYLVHLGHGWTRGDLITILAAATPLLLGGVLFGVLVLATGAIGPSMLAHALTNLMALPLEWDLAGSFNLEPVYVTGIDRHFVSWCAAGCLSLALTAYALSRLVRPRRLLRAEGFVADE
jgi:membrane protease YdiL (CAAX protease family)